MDLRSMSLSIKVVYSLSRNYFKARIHRWFDDVRPCNRMIGYYRTRSLDRESSVTPDLKNFYYSYSLINESNNHYDYMYDNE